LPNHHLIATGIATPFLIPLKLTAFIALLISLPLCFYQLWAFIAPGLYPHEKKWLIPLTGLSLVLFALGVGFAYGVVAPLALSFFIQAAPSSVAVTTDLKNYMDFMLTLVVAFGLSFQVPLVVLGLLKFKLVEKSTLTKSRPTVIVIAFVVGMLLTPPDVISQVLLAIPLWGLFELGLLLGMIL